MKRLKKQNDVLTNAYVEDISKVISKYINIVDEKKGKYTNEDMAVVCLLSASEQISLQEASEILQSEGFDVPSGDTVLYHLGKNNFRIFEEMFSDIFEEYLKRATKKGINYENVTLAIDQHDMPWYGKDLEYITRSKEKASTTHFISFATIAIVEDGRRFTLWALPVTPFTKQEDTVRELIKKVKPLVEIQTVLLDRGYFSADVINALEDVDISYIMPAVKNSRIQKIINIEDDIENIMVNMKDARFNLEIYTTKEGKKLPYATNIISNANDIHNQYFHRFGIEAQYRIKNKFKAYTTSRSYSVRYVFFLLSLTIYNLWILINIVQRNELKLQDDKLPLTASRLRWYIKRAFMLKIDEYGDNMDNS